MATIYLSSTYQDLRAHREAVYQQLRRMKHEVTAMEDYVARDDRPADRCLQDVAQSDLYVGLFAWRYGFVPATGNPTGLSVTELEYREARRRGIPSLVFLLDETAAWPPKLLDSFTGDGMGGAQIRKLRDELGVDRLVSFFTSAEDLAAKVSASVHLATAVDDASNASFDLAQIVDADTIDRSELLFNQSYVPFLIQRIAALGDAPLLTIDLRDGAYWWSTRLFALATLAADYTDVEWLLFLERGTDYVGMIRPRDLRRALATAHPQFEEKYREAQKEPWQPGVPPGIRAGQVLEKLVSQFGGQREREERLRFLVDAAWLSAHAALSTVHVERSGPIDPLATLDLLKASTPYVPITARGRIVKVIDRVGVATEMARTVVERRLGRRE